MSADISREAYQTYLDQFTLYSRGWPNLAGQPKTYEEWADATQHRDHPRWVEYMRARRDWKASTFHITYGPEAETRPFPQFPEFEEWLAGIEAVTKDYPALLDTDEEQNAALPSISDMAVGTTFTARHADHWKRFEYVGEGRIRFVGGNGVAFLVNGPHGVRIDLSTIRDVTPPKEHQ